MVGDRSLPRLLEKLGYKGPESSEVFLSDCRVPVENVLGAQEGHGLQQALFFTPFPYQLYFPISVYLGKLSSAELIRGFAIQFGWIFFAYGLARFAWGRGIRKYSAVGG